MHLFQGMYLAIATIVQDKVLCLGVVYQLTFKFKIKAVCKIIIYLDMLVRYFCWLNTNQDHLGEGSSTEKKPMGYFHDK